MYDYYIIITIYSVYALDDSPIYRVLQYKKRCIIYRFHPCYLVFSSESLDFSSVFLASACWRRLVRRRRNDGFSSSSSSTLPSTGVSSLTFLSLSSSLAVSSVSCASS